MKPYLSFLFLVLSALLLWLALPAYKSNSDSNHDQVKVDPFSGADRDSVRLAAKRISISEDRNVVEGKAKSEDLEEKSNLSSFIEGMVIQGKGASQFFSRASVRVVQAVSFSTVSEYVRPRIFHAQVDANGAYRVAATPGFYELEIQVNGTTYWAQTLALHEDETKLYNFYLNGGFKVYGRFQFEKYPEASTFLLDVIRQEDGHRVATTIVSADRTGSRPKKGNRDPIPEDMIEEPKHGEFAVSNLSPDRYILRFSLLPILPGIKEEIFWEHKVDLRNGDVSFGTKYASLEGFEKERERRNSLAEQAMALGLLPKFKK